MPNPINIFLNTWEPLLSGIIVPIITLLINYVRRYRHKYILLEKIDFYSDYTRRVLFLMLFESLRFVFVVLFSCVALYSVLLIKENLSEVNYYGVWYDLKRNAPGFAFLSLYVAIAFYCITKLKIHARKPAILLFCIIPILLHAFITIISVQIWGFPLLIIAFAITILLYASLDTVLGLTHPYISIYNCILLKALRHARNIYACIFIAYLFLASIWLDSAQFGFCYSVFCYLWIITCFVENLLIFNANKVECIYYRIRFTNNKSVLCTSIINADEEYVNINFDDGNFLQVEVAQIREIEFIVPTYLNCYKLLDRSVRCTKKGMLEVEYYCKYNFRNGWVTLYNQKDKYVKGLIVRRETLGNIWTTSNKPLMRFLLK